jgi:hypothetical protein
MAVTAVEDVSETLSALASPGLNGEATAESGEAKPEGGLSGEAESYSVNVWNDEAAESAFRAEARQRGEPLSAPAPAAEPEEETENGDKKNLPPVEELVKRLSPEVREVLDDLFRAKFTTVRRVPAKALKS